MERFFHSQNLRMNFPLRRFLAEGHKAVKMYFGSKKRGFCQANLEMSGFHSLDPVEIPGSYRPFPGRRSRLLLAPKIQAPSDIAETKRHAGGKEILKNGGGVGIEKVDSP